MNKFTVFIVALLFVVLLSNSVLAKKSKDRCSKKGLEKPAEEINKECEGKRLCRDSCVRAVCDMVDIFLDECPEESQPSIELLLTAMNDEYEKECGDKIGCIPDFFKTSSAASVTLSAVTVAVTLLIALISISF